jgi:hypothetical protein
VTLFTSLSQFYNSDIWRKFRQQLILERVNPADGILYDEFSGKPLLNSYDIVAHHKVPLTMQNVNDFAISLNPENIMLVSQRSHNELHSRFGYCTQRKVYLVTGAPCAGKSSFVNGIKGNSDLIVDIDNVWECLTGKRYDKPNALKTNAFTLRDCLLDMVKTRAGKWERAFVIEGAPHKSERERKLQMLGAELIHIDTSKEVCLQRLYSDESRRDVRAQWKEYIERYFDSYQE